MTTRGAVGKRIFKMLDDNPNLTPTQIAKQLGCPSGTAASGKNRWKKARGFAIGTRKHPIISAQPAGKPKLTVEDILNAGFTIPELGEILFEGVNVALQRKDDLLDTKDSEIAEMQSRHQRELAERDDAIITMQEERQKLMNDYNTRLAKGRVNPSTVNQTTHRIEKRS